MAATEKLRAWFGDSEEEPEYPAPLDLYYSFSMDRGENYAEVEWVVNGDPTNPDSLGQVPPAASNASHVHHGSSSGRLSTTAPVAVHSPSPTRIAVV